MHDKVIELLYIISPYVSAVCAAITELVLNDSNAQHIVTVSCMFYICLVYFVLQSPASTLYRTLGS